MLVVQEKEAAEASEAVEQVNMVQVVVLVIFGKAVVGLLMGARAYLKTYN